MVVLLFLLPVLLLAFPSQTAKADYQDGDYAYTVDGGQATIIGYTGTGGDVVIPSTLGDYPVIAIGDRAFEYCLYVTTITIPDGVTSIGDYAFQGCNYLARVEIPGSVTSIGDYVFYECRGWLKEINVDSSNSHYMSIDGNLFNKEGTILIQYAIAKEENTYTIPGTVMTIGPGAFQDCIKLTSVIIPDSVTCIGDNAFLDCLYLASVTIPNSVTSIGSGAFSGCMSLTSVTIPSSVTGIGNEAFRHCISLTSVTLSSSLSSIGEMAFDGCSSLTSITFLGLTPPTTGICWIRGTPSELRGHAYYGSGFPVPGYWFDGLLMGDNILEYNYAIVGEQATITKYIGVRRDVPIPDTLGGYPVVAIGTDAFRSLPVTSVTIPNSVTSIANNVFYRCTSLTSVTIPNSVTSIGTYAFYRCWSLTSVTIPSSVTSIGDWTFAYCTSLESITIPDSITSIGYAAFHQCTKLASIHFHGDKPSVGAYWIRGTPSHIRGHAFHSSNFPAPGEVFSTLTMGSYLANVTFSQTGVAPSSTTGIVLTVNNTGYQASELPVTFTWYSGDTISFSWSEFVGIDSGSRYRWQLGEGLSDSRSGTITVPDEGGAVAALYEIEYAVTVSANPSEGGSVSGRGYYTEGTQVTVTATAKKGYSFVNWTEGGVIVSTDASYTFDMGTAARTLVANFGKVDEKPEKPEKPGKPK